MKVLQKNEREENSQFTIELFNVSKTQAKFSLLKIFLKILMKMLLKIYKICRNKFVSIRKNKIAKNYFLKITRLKPNSKSYEQGYKDFTVS